MCRESKREYKSAGRKDVFQTMITELSQNSRLLCRLMVETNVHLRHNASLFSWKQLGLLYSTEGDTDILLIQYQGLVHALVRFLEQKAAKSQHRSVMSLADTKESLLFDYAG